MSTGEARVETTRYVGPSPLAPAGAYVALFVASLVVGGAAGGFSTPATSAADVVAAAAKHPGTGHFVAVLQLAAAVGLGVFAAASIGVIRSRGVDVAGLQIARFGGYGAAMLLALSAISGWCTIELAQVNEPGAAKATSLLAFVCGGPAHVVFLGLFMAGVSVPTLLARLVPRWISILGLVLALVAAVSLLSLGVSQLQILLPIVRFPSLIWTVAAAATVGGWGRDR